MWTRNLGAVYMLLYAAGRAGSRQVSRRPLRDRTDEVHASSAPPRLSELVARTPLGGVSVSRDTAPMTSSAAAAAAAAAAVRRTCWRAGCWRGAAVACAKR